MLLTLCLAHYAFHVVISHLITPVAVVKKNNPAGQ